MRWDMISKSVPNKLDFSLPSSTTNLQFQRLMQEIVNQRLLRLWNYNFFSCYKKFSSVSFVWFKVILAMQWYRKKILGYTDIHLMKTLMLFHYRLFYWAHFVKKYSVFFDALHTYFSRRLNISSNPEKDTFHVICISFETHK